MQDPGTSGGSQWLVSVEQVLQGVGPLEAEAVLFQEEEAPGFVGLEGRTSWVLHAEWMGVPRAVPGRASGALWVLGHLFSARSPWCSVSRP